MNDTIKQPIKLTLYDTCGTMGAKPNGPNSTPATIVPNDINLLPGVIEELREERAQTNGMRQYPEVNFVKWKIYGDSKDFSEADMAEMAVSIKKDLKENGTRKFLIVHGTDDMAKNAQLLKQYLQGSGVVVAFTGAMLPLSYDPTEGKKNVSDAIRFLEQTPSTLENSSGGPKVKIIWDSKVWEPAYTKKDIPNKCFVSSIPPRDLAHYIA